MLYPQRSIRFYLLTLFSSFLMACGGSSGSSSSGGNGTDPDPVSEGSALLDVAPVSNSAAPYRLLELVGVPEDTGPAELHAEFRHVSDSKGIGPDEDEGELALVMQPGGREEHYLLVPLLDPDGSEIDLRVTDGEEYSELFTLTISALPAREQGAFDDLLDEVEHFVEHLAARYELDYPGDFQDVIETGAHAVAPEAMPLVRAWYAVGDPALTGNHEHSLRNANLSADELALLERLIVHMELVQETAGFADLVATGDDALDVLFDDFLPAMDTTSELQTGSSTASLSKQPYTGGAGATRWDGWVSIDTPQELRQKMSQYEDARMVQREVQRIDDIATYTITGAGIAVAFASGGTATPAVVAALQGLALAEAAVSTMGLVSDLVMATMAFYPCCIQSVEIETDPESRFVEHEDAGEPQLKLTEVNALATSDPVNLTGDLLQPFLESAVQGRVSSRIEEKLNDVQQVPVDASTEALMSQLNLPEQKIGFQWEVDLTWITPEIWLDFEHTSFVGGPRIFQHDKRQAQIYFELDPEFFFTNPGSDDRIAVHPSDEFPMGFWHPPIPGDSARIGAQTIEVDFMPPALLIDEPGETHEFTVTVRNALDDSIDVERIKDLTAEEGSVEGPLNNQSPWEFRYHAPEDELPPSTFVIATEATTDGGVRGALSEANTFPRRGTMFVRTEGEMLMVEPEFSCLDEGQTGTFTARNLMTGENIDVEWQTDVGSISADGTFTSPGRAFQATEATITATSSDDPDVSGTAQVALACDCWQQGSVGGDIGEAGAGWTSIIRSYGDDGESINRLQLGVDTVEPATAIVLNFEPDLVPGFIGTTTATVSLGSFGGSPTGWSSWRDEPVQVNVTRNKIIGNLSVTLPSDSRILAMEVVGPVSGGFEVVNGQLVIRTGILNLEHQGIYRGPTPSGLACQSLSSSLRDELDLD